MSKLTEYKLMEEEFIKKLSEKEWDYRKPENLGRSSETEIVIQEIFIEAIKRINKNLSLSNADQQKVLQDLLNQTTSMNGIQKVLEYYKDGVPLKLEETKTLERINLFDYEDIKNNSFIFSNQVSFYGETEKIRVDLILYVNGIPLVVIECKNYANPTLSWVDGFKQVKKEYEKKVPELFKFVQFSIAAEAVIKYFPNVLADTEVKCEEWKAKKKIVERRKEDGEKSAPSPNLSHQGRGTEGFGREKEINLSALDSIVEMLSKETLLDIIKNFTFVRNDEGTLTKVLPRYMQYEAVNLIYDRVVKNIRGEDNKNRGLLWHWLGSGKTLTMIFAAFKIYREPLLENPTIFFVVDRLDLEEQLKTEYNKLSLPKLPAIEEVKSSKELKDILEHDSFKGKRGIFIILVHKFGSEEISKVQAYLEEKKDTISQRKNVITFIDEAHRTQYGSMAFKMKDILTNAFFFAFTGTPISIKGKDTYRDFAYRETGEKYLHKYFIEDSIRDGFTKPITFEGYYKEEISLEDEQIDDFLNFKELIDDEEIPEDYRNKFEEKVKKKLDYINVILKDEERIDKIVGEIAGHFKERLDGIYKAMIIAPDREACVMYKERLDKLLPTEYSEIVMTFNDKVDEDIKRLKNYHKTWREKYGLFEDREIRKKIVENFKTEDKPKILIVTDMLLTGFDAPILQTIYLDKLLRGHKLLQATARVNRPYKEIKEFGLVKDFVGILKHYYKALAIYRAEDVKDVFSEFEEEKKKFKNLISEIKIIFNDKAEFVLKHDDISGAVQFLLDSPQPANEFTKKYRELRNLLLLIGYEALTDCIPDFEWIYAVYQYFLKVKNQDDVFIDELVKKNFERILKKIHEKIEIKNLIKKLEPLTIDEKYLAKLDDIYSQKELPIKIYDMYYSLCRYVYIDKVRSQIFASLLEKIENIIENWHQHKVNSQETYDLLKTVIVEVIGKEKSKKDLGIIDEVFYVYQFLSNKVAKVDKGFIKGINDLLEGLKNENLLFKDSLSKESNKKEVMKKVRFYLIGLKNTGIDMTLPERDVYIEKIVNFLKSYY